MTHTCRLEISLHRAVAPVMPGDAHVDRVRGGPMSLLRWLETCLGLTPVDTASSARVTQYAAALAARPGPSFDASLGVDRWATAAALLSRRDALLLAGWDKQDDPGLPTLVRDLSKVESDLAAFPLGIAERLHAVVQALDVGQVLPTHVCELKEAPPQWPAAWRPILDRLTVTLGKEPHPAADGLALNHVQTALVSAVDEPVSPDESIRLIAARSRLAACEAVATMLHASGDALAETVIVCEQDDDALLLDASLARMGLPTMGASRRRGAEAPLAVLPLALGLCWEPVDPSILYEFLTLPASPIPGKARGKLSWALQQQPGFGSAAWDKAYETLVDPANDTDGTMRARLELWLNHPRAPVGQPLNYPALAAVCARIAQWAVGRARQIEENDPESALVPLFDAAGGQASALSELAGNHAAPLTEAQVARLLEAVQVAAEARPLHAALAGGPTLVRTLQDVPAGTKRLIWFGLSTRDTSPSPWTPAQLKALRAAGIDVDDGTRDVRSLRAVQRSTLMGVTGHLLAVQLPSDEGSRPHPVWVQVSVALGSAAPIWIENLVEDPTTFDLSPWSIRTNSTRVEAPQPLRPEWNIPVTLLSDVERSSASELEERLACPTKWVLNRQARLRSRGLGTLPDGPQLFGNLCHDVLQRVFGEGGAAPTPEAAVDAAGVCFDERVRLDAAVLAQPARASEVTRLRAQLLSSTRAFVDLLHTGGYRVKAIEAPIDAKFDERPLTGSIDCVLERGEDEAILDFKFGNDGKYRELLEEGRATQLATYAHARGLERGSPEAVKGAGYLIIARAAILTPEGSPLEGARTRDIIRHAPSIHETWGEFATALSGADGWLRGETPVPTRPLQPPSKWPPGSRLVLTAEAKEDKGQDICRYCDHKRLCGLEEIA